MIFERKILKTVDIVNDSKLQESIHLKWDMHLVCGAQIIGRQELKMLDDSTFSES